MNWRTELRPTDVYTGEGQQLYVYARIRPSWYWTVRQIRLFLKIVWRRYESDRIDWDTAWEVSKVARGD